MTYNKFCREGELSEWSRIPCEHAFAWRLSRVPVTFNLTRTRNRLSGFNFITNAELDFCPRWNLSDDDAYDIYDNFTMELL